MNKDPKPIWFPAKRYGWGWGLPCAWQGWVVMVAFILLLAGAGVLFLPGKHFGLWAASIIVLVAALILICLKKGEKPHWRWGKD